ncbi:uncharacterized protein CMU_033280 [Cryptosporidium muris RN66]|uniref:Uncharacterized protein n=1 Tax=Cryptosporidium muris (strain RN66) TaxID=441375 RepID=B6AFF2_CRYMR|nr:uncharacterized protein CMU_033280 [Cryptosporidium muris RN66]EEA06943.1 hypothetical protein CMU_033280 [Cryptosporidium muris RN66]|eukprot:XP_002141292.1 hypothetical protein [Cryptosporidium muris RN66]
MLFISSNVLARLTFLFIVILINETSGNLLEQVISQYGPQVTASGSACVLYTSQLSLSGYGNISPKVSIKKIIESSEYCKNRINNFQPPTITEEALFITLGQYGYSEYVDIMETIKFANIIGNGISNPILAYNEIIKKISDPDFCNEYEVYLKMALPSSFPKLQLPLSMEKCSKFTRRLKSNAFYIYWSKGGIIIDQANELPEETVSNDEIFSSGSVEKRDLQENILDTRNKEDNILNEQVVVEQEEISNIEIGSPPKKSKRLYCGYNESKTTQAPPEEIELLSDVSPPTKEQQLSRRKNCHLRNKHIFNEQGSQAIKKEKCSCKTSRRNKEPIIDSILEEESVDINNNFEPQNKQDASEESVNENLSQSGTTDTVPGEKKSCYKYKKKDFKSTGNQDQKKCFNIKCKSTKTPELGDEETALCNSNLDSNSFTVGNEKRSCYKKRNQYISLNSKSKDPNENCCKKKKKYKLFSQTPNVSFVPACSELQG